MRNFLIVALLVAVVGFGYWYKTNRALAPMGDGQRMITDDIVIDDTDGKIRADVFQGELEEVNTGCFADAECYVVVDGKHVTTTMGWSQATVGSLVGVESFGDLENHIGDEFEVYAQEKEDGTYTLYGSAGFYVKLLGETI